MKNLLELALEAHGGLTRWSELRAVTAAETSVKARNLNWAGKSSQGEIQ